MHEQGMFDVVDGKIRHKSLEKMINEPCLIIDTYPKDGGCCCLQVGDRPFVEKYYHCMISSYETFNLHNMNGTVKFMVLEESETFTVDDIATTLNAATQISRNPLIRQIVDGNTVQMRECLDQLQEIGY